MRIKKDKSDEFVAWMSYMNSSGEITVTEFFNLLCQNSDQGYDAVVIVSNVLMNKECDRPYEASNNDVYLAMYAFSNFHENGDDFRRRWNMGEMHINYAKYIEEGNIKHVATPFAYHSIFESHFFDDTNDQKDEDGNEDDDDSDTWRSGEQ
ncbi:MAG: hypothetical protein ACYC3G_01350 [Minisyncoccota bacterium]